MRALLIAGLLLALTAVPASAHHGMLSGPECGVREWDGVAFMTKGRTDGMVYQVDHTVGCKRVVIRNLVGTGRGESYGYAGQEANCQRYGKQDAVNTFNYYWHETVSPDDIAVTCSRYQGPD